MSDPNYQQVAQTTIDLKIIQKQLDVIESTLLNAWRYIQRTPYTQEAEQEISEAIDTLLAVKKAFHLTSDLIPVKEQLIASKTEQIRMPQKWREEQIGERE